MGMDLYVKFLRPLDADELSNWADDLFTDYDLERAQKQFKDYQDLNPYTQHIEIEAARFNKRTRGIGNLVDNGLFIDVSHIAWKEIEGGPYRWLFSQFFGTYEWDIAMLGRRWWVDDIKALIPQEQLEIYEEYAYLPPCGSLSIYASEKFAWNHKSQLNGLGDGKFPIVALDYFYWG